MKCPVCQSQLTISKIKGTVQITGKLYSYEIECPMARANKSNHFYGLQDQMEPDNILYITSVEVDGTTYAWQASYETNSTRISKVNKDENGRAINIKLLTKLDEYYPMQEDTKQYEEVIRRILNLKAFL